MSDSLALTFKDREGSLQQLKEELATKVGKAQAVVLLGKTPKSEIRHRLMNPRNPKGPNNPEFDYLEHAYVEQTLNFAFMLNWSVEVTHRERIESEAFIEVLLTLNFKDGTVVKKSGFGGAAKLNNFNQSWGDVFKSAYSDAIKNAATKLGIGLDLYRHEEVVVEKTQKIDAQAPGQPTDEQRGKPALEAQLQAIQNMGGTLPESEEDRAKITFGQAVDWIAQLRAKKNGGAK